MLTNTPNTQHTSPLPSYTHLFFMCSSVFPTIHIFRQLVDSFSNTLIEDSVTLQQAINFPFTLKSSFLQFFCVFCQTRAQEGTNQSNRKTISARGLNFVSLGKSFSRNVSSHGRISTKRQRDTKSPTDDFLRPSLGDSTHDIQTLPGIQLSNNLSPNNETQKRQRRNPSPSLERSSQPPERQSTNDE